MSTRTKVWHVLRGFLMIIGFLLVVYVLATYKQLLP